jgi:hypothetical protein
MAHLDRVTDDEPTDEAADSGDGAALVPAMSGSIPEMKALRERCLAAGIPATLGCPPGASGGKSCGTRTHLLVGEDAIPRLAALLRDEWQEAFAREGLDPVELAATSDAEHLPCPACGTAAPLADGACTDCGLQLE